MLYLAIDQHSKQLTVNLRNEDGQVRTKRQVSTRPEKVRRFFDDIAHQAKVEDGFMTIVEVCGFNDWLLKLLGDYGCQEVVLVQAEKRSKRKTDRRDANQLGEILWLNRERILAGQPVHGLRRVHIPSPEDRDNRSLTMMRQQVGKERTRVVNRVRHLLRRHNLQWEMPTKTFKTKQVRKWLGDLSLSDLDRLEMDHLLERWEVLDRQCEQLEEQIQQRYEASDAAVLIGSLPGAGAYISLGLACRVGAIERFSSPDSLANYWGLTPSSRNSGEASQRLGSITKQGSSMARFLLGQLVIHVLRRDGTMRSWYQRIRRRRGSKIGRVAVMRRLATILWHMLKRREPYICGGREQIETTRRTVEAVAAL